MPDYTRQNQAPPHDEEETQHNPFANRDSATLFADEDEPEIPELLENREAYLELRPRVLYYPAMLGGSAHLTQLYYSDDDDHQVVVPNLAGASRLRPHSKKRSLRVMNRPDRARTAPPDPDARPIPRQANHLWFVPALVHAQNYQNNSQSAESAYLTPSLPSALDPDTPSNPEASQYSTAESDSAGSAQLSDFPSPPGSNDENEAEVKMREVEEEQDERLDRTTTVLRPADVPKKEKLGRSRTPPLERPTELEEEVQRATLMLLRKGEDPRVQAAVYGDTVPGLGLNAVVSKVAARFPAGKYGHQYDSELPSAVAHRP